ncbi:ACP S-malonyltransferase [Cohnella sp. CFH 77786]|uniref:ACP S-malonyltransferase n=1 Tax=Cohnella sp. CFH 77786 TaxID=2662265 RepID=UPI001C60BA96|nr:ACP S-malonyltransferase [Cohnella sp. CFH 77786]MBW5446413.1 ACP S-malonyltransferase [Cohnella sp. CFH 77786]
MAKWAHLYPGQGSQYVGMGKKLRDDSETARRVFEEADDLLGFRLSSVIFEGDPERLTRTDMTQPALLTVSVAAFRVLTERTGAEPDYAAGHSLGEWSALACAGAIGFSDAIRLVSLRGRLMQEAAEEGGGAMCAVLGIDREAVEETCRGLSAPGAEVVVSNINSPGQTVISGRADAVRQASERLERLGARTAYLNVGAPFHSPLMAPAAERLRAELKPQAFTLPRWPVVSNVTAVPYSSPEEIVRLLAEQIVAPVRWEETMRFLRGAGVTAVVEIGPMTVLTRLAKAIEKEMSAFSFEKPEQWTELREGMKPFLERSSPAARRFVARCLTAAAGTRNRNWDERAYREGVIEPYQAIEAIQARLDAEDRGPDIGEMAEALSLLVRIFETKGVPSAERVERLFEIVERTGTGDRFPQYALRVPEPATAPATDSAHPGGAANGLRIG